MMAMLRSFFTGGFLWMIVQVCRFGKAPVETDLVSAVWFAVAVLMGIVAACTWLPVIRLRKSRSVVGMTTDGSTYESRGGRYHWVFSALQRGHRRLALFLCFLRGVWEPDQPSAFVIGMENARPGSWLEKVFALEVWRFDNTLKCVRAYEVLRDRHSLLPRAHKQATVNMAVQARLSHARPGVVSLSIPPPTPRPILTRRAGIQLFKDAESSGPPDAAP